MEQSALSAPGSLSDARYSSPDDRAWETVVKKGNKGSKAAAASKVTAATSAAAAAVTPSLQTQSSGLSQSGRSASGALAALSSQQTGAAQTSVDTPAFKSAEALHPEGSLSGGSVASAHGREISMDDDALMGSSVWLEQKPAQQQSGAGQAVPEVGASVMQAAAQEAISRAGLQAPAPPLRPSNWAGLLKSPQHQQQPQQHVSVSQELEEEESASLSAAPIVSDDSFPQLGTALGSGVDNPTPSQLSVSDHTLSYDKSQGLSHTPSEAEVLSVSSSPFAGTTPQDALASDVSQTTVNSTASGQESQDQITQQLHANAAIWGSGLTSGALSGISVLQLPQQPPQQMQQQQQPSGLYQAPASAAAPPANNPWDPQPPTQRPASSAAPPQAPARPAAAPIKSVLPPNAQPFIPQARLSAPPQGQQSAFQGQAHQQHARQQQQHQQAAAASQQQGMPGAHAFLHGNTFGRAQQPGSSMSPSPYANTSGFDSMLRPQQTHGLGLPPGSLLDPGMSRGMDPNINAAALHRQRQLQQQQQQQAGVTSRQQQPQTQQQLADIWAQPSLGLHQNGGMSAQSSGPFGSHQQPSVPKGKSAGNGPFAAHQGAGSAFQQHQVPFSQQQYPGLHQQQQGRGDRFASRPANGNHFAGSSMNGLANGHLSSTGNQSEEDELLSGVFTKVWEDNLQVLCSLITALCLPNM